MDLNSAKLKRNAGLIYGTIIFLGALLSTFVYTSTQKIKHNTLTLVDHEIKVFERLQKLDTLFIEQELYLNEYYANQNESLYQVQFLKTAEQVDIELRVLEQVGVPLEQVNALKSIQSKTAELAKSFDQNMRLGDPNSGAMWDLARSHLETLAMYRGEIKPVVTQIGISTNQRIAVQYENTKNSLDRTIQLVLAYSGLIIFIAFVVGRAIKTSISVSVKNKRLALFPQRNPNPILSLDEKNGVKYSNPAMTELLAGLNIELNDFMAHLHDTLKEQQGVIRNEGLSHDKVLITIGELLLECNIHWLADLNSWDLHFVDITQKHAAQTQLNYQAFHDQQTGLFNRNQLYLDLDKICDQEDRYAISLFEIRGFSQIVSRIGLQQTEVLVGQLANTLKNEVTLILPNDHHTLYRTSEKQFALVIQTTACEIEITKLVSQLERIVEARVFNNGVNLELDFGFTCYPEHTTDAHSIIKSATIALDQAIAIDHASVVIYSEQLGQFITKELALTDQLRNAIENQELTLHFQPQLDIQKQQIVGVETLVRWPTDDGFISPMEFIPIAEKSGLIITLGNWIMLQACYKAAELIELGYKDIVVAINISPQQFNHPSFYETVLGVLAQSQVPPQNIELEITEGVIMYNESETIALLHQLKETGVKLSIDDFGTGYSSLSYLKQFPIDKLKIDQSFIKQIEKNNDDKAIVSTVIDLGNNLGLTLIAEGVEEQSHLDILYELGCQEIQGYFFSRPLSSDVLNQFLETFHEDKKLSLSARVN